MTKPKFNNRPNEVFRMRYDSNSKGRVAIDYWISRAPTLNGLILAFGADGGTRVLVCKRSIFMRDEPLKYCLPCGYLDWDENGYDGITREVYEETSLYLPDYKPFLIENNGGEPYHTNTNPKLNNQNVSLTYLFVLDFKNSPEFFPNEIEKFTCNETAKVMWLKISELDSLDWAFNHDKQIQHAIEFYNKGK